MGYYTNHIVTAEPALTDEQLKALAEIADYSVDSLTGAEDIKWYNRVEDMKALSLRYPTVVFRVDGQGEENGDVWVEWYRNGDSNRWELELSVPGGFDPPGGWA